MGRSEYMRINIIKIPPDVITQYKLNYLSNQDGWIYMEIIEGIYELPQAFTLANNLLAKHLHHHGYYQANNTPLLWQHVWRPVLFILVGEVFWIGYVGRDNPDHLMSALKTFYENITTYLKKHYTVV